MVTSLPLYSAILPSRVSGFMGTGFPAVTYTMRKLRRRSMPSNEPCLGPMVRRREESS